MPASVGVQGLLVVGLVLVLLFGAKRLPELGRSLGRGMREFKEGIAGRERTAGDPADAAQSRISENRIRVTRSSSDTGRL